VTVERPTVARDVQGDAASVADPLGDENLAEHSGSVRAYAVDPAALERGTALEPPA
jgi:hypothetical protein